MKRAFTKTPSKGSKTDWKRVDGLSDADLDLSETREVTPEEFQRALPRKGLKPLQRKRSGSSRP